jgi:hypothetical protein
MERVQYQVCKAVKVAVIRSVYRWLAGTGGVEVYDRKCVRCSPSSVPSPSGDGPAETYVVGVHPASLVIDQADERPNDQA